MGCKTNQFIYIVGWEDFLPSCFLSSLKDTFFSCEKKTNCYDGEQGWERPPFHTHTLTEAGGGSLGFSEFPKIPGDSGGWGTTFTTQLNIVKHTNTLINEREHRQEDSLFLPFRHPVSGWVVDHGCEWLSVTLNQLWWPLALFQSSLTLLNITSLFSSLTCPFSCWGQIKRGILGNVQF